jgi:hypothetical protein
VDVAVYVTLPVPLQREEAAPDTKTGIPGAEPVADTSSVAEKLYLKHPSVTLQR